MKKSISLVRKTFNNLFGEEPESDELFNELQTYEGPEKERVRLAFLKLSERDPGETAFPLKFLGKRSLPYELLSHM